ncbi:MAG: secretin N-terminal domain-containing protein [Planctomycetota bacterium]
MIRRRLWFAVSRDIQAFRLNLVVFALFWCLHSPEQTAFSQDSENVTASADLSPIEEVRFSFNGVSWREVITWIADEAGLALHVDSVPPGSFTYTDPGSFTFNEAIDRINLFLLPQGHALVRNGDLLSVINMSDPRSLKQLDALAPMVRPEDLENLQGHDVVKCLYPLGSLDAEEAIEELSSLQLMTNPVPLTKTNQLLITDTARKLLGVKRILDSFEPSKLDNGTIVKSFNLSHVDAEDVLAVARPHLGLATGEMIGIDVSLSADLQGRSIFATGIEDKVKLIEKLVQEIDVPEKSLADGDSQSELQTHTVAGRNVDLAYDVLQTLLVGKNVRISKDEVAGTIVALAPEAIQKDIAETIRQLGAAEAEFEVIPLRTTDPYVAIALITQMLDLSNYTSDDEDSIAIEPPTIDADPDNRRLFVRGTPRQIEEIKGIVDGLDSPKFDVDGSSAVRVLGFFGGSAIRKLQLAAKTWNQPNPVVVIQGADGNGPLEKVFHDEGPSSNQRTRIESESDFASDLSSPSFKTISNARATKLVAVRDRKKLLDSPSLDISEAPIECRLTESGLVIQSDDVRALNRFESHLISLSTTSPETVSEPVVYYLKYTRPVDAIRMLAELLNGGDTITGPAGSLVNASVSIPGSVIGSLITNRDGTITLNAGTATVVADSRLNRLIVQGTSDEVARIESYLQIIEKDSGLTQVETYGRSHVIELVNTKASEVEEAIRAAYAGRVVESAKGGRNEGQSSFSSASREEYERRFRGRGDEDDEKGRGKSEPKSASKQAIDLEPKMTLSVHEPSNSLIVTAPDQLFEEVEKLAMKIDQRGETVIRVFTPGTSEVLETALEQLFLGQSSGRSDRKRSSSGSGSRDRDRDR